MTNPVPCGELEGHPWISMPQCWHAGGLRMLRTVEFGVSKMKTYEISCNSRTYLEHRMGNHTLGVKKCSRTEKEGRGKQGNRRGIIFFPLKTFRPFFLVFVLFQSECTIAIRFHTLRRCSAGFQRASFRSILQRSRRRRQLAELHSLWVAFRARSACQPGSL